MFSVRKRPYSGVDSSEFCEVGAVAIQHDSSYTPPLAISFCKVGFLSMSTRAPPSDFFFQSSVFPRVQMIKSYEYDILIFFLLEIFRHPNGVTNINIRGQVKFLLICKILTLQTSKNSHILAVSDEDGYVSLFDSRRRHPSFASYQEKTGFFSLSDYILGF